MPPRTTASRASTTAISKGQPPQPNRKRKRNTRKHDWVICPCCMQKVTKKTRYNHLNLGHGAPNIRAQAFGYHHGHATLGGETDFESVEPEARQRNNWADARRIHSPEPLAGPSQLLDGGNFDSGSTDSSSDNSIDEDDSDASSDGGDAGNGMGWGWADLEDVEEEDTVAVELEERNEDGLLAYERLSETFERELVDIADALSPSDQALLRTFAYKTRTKMTREMFRMLPFAFPGAPDTTSEQVDSRAAFLSGIDPQLHDCCPKSCVLYVGPRAELQSCPVCGEPRYNAVGRPRKKFTYIPVIPRLLALFRNAETATQMQYRAEFVEKTQSKVRHTLPLPECSLHHERSGQGQRGVCYCPSEIKDIFDGSQYRALCDTPVTVDGHVQSHHFFSDKRDVALGFSTDGFAPFKRGKQTCWPLILYNYNLPPEDRFQQDNILCVGVIPGPKKPHDFDSFLFLLILELLQLAAGVVAFDGLRLVQFMLHVYIILGGGDIPAVSMVLRMKGHNAFCPCRMCRILGVQIPNSTAKVYYIPLDRSRHPSLADNPAAVSRYNPLQLPMRTHAEFIQEAYNVQSSPSQAEEGRRSKRCGIKGLPILSYLSSLSFPLSFPFDFMHLFWENLLPNLVLLWTGGFKGLDEGAEAYQINATVWQAIGKATAESGRTIPSVFGPRLKDFHEERMWYTADMWSFWALYLGPTLLHRKFSHVKYYNHFIELIRLLHICLKYELTHEDVVDLRKGFAKWVEDFERFYYQYNPQRLSTCLLTVHALLHVADSIEAVGPAWAYWAFPMERYCGRLQRAIKSRRYPFASIDTFVTADARLKHIGLVWNIRQMLSLRPPSSGSELRAYEVQIPNYDSCAISAPYVKKGKTTDMQLIRRVCVHLATRYNVPRQQFTALSRLVTSNTVEQYGKVRRLQGGDMMHAEALAPLTEDRREATFVRYEIFVDRNAHRRNAPEDLEIQTFFGQMHHIVVVTLPPSALLGLTEETQLLLVDIKTCKADIDGPLGMKIYQHMTINQVIDMSCVQCLVGRFAVTLPNERHGWAIIDRSGENAQALAHVDYEPDGDSDGGEDS